MIRAASKNHRFVTVVTDPVDYAPLLDQLRAHDGATTLAFRQKLALIAYSRTAAYDTAVSTWLAGEINEPTPRYRSFAGKLAQPLRVAITGTQVSPSIDHTVYLAGRDEALKRIDAALQKIADRAP